MPERRGRTWAGLVVAIAAAHAVAEDAAPPRLRMAIPFSAAAGGRVKVVIRGWNLAVASAVHVDLPDAAPAVVAKGAAAVPAGHNAAVIGAEQVEFEMTLPAGTAAGPIAVRVESPAGLSDPYSFLVTTADIAEVEPNEAFTTAQPLTPPAVVAGAIQAERDVDVFHVACATGRTLVARLEARSHGSALDGVLSLYADDGTLVAVHDDGPSADAEVRVPITVSGTYRLVLQDANDRGGPTHPYRLSVTLE